MRIFQFFVIIFFMVGIQQGRAQTQVREDTLEDLVALKGDMTQKNEIEHRYVIQLGSYSQMSDAEDVLKEFKKEHSDVLGRMEYESPNYKVWVGSFTSRLSAERLYVKLKGEFKSAFVFKPR